MPEITLPDGSVRSFDAGVTAHDIAQGISGRLAKEALVARVDGELYDLTRTIEGDARVEIVKGDDPDGVELLRHDAAHVLAQAVKELYPETQVTIGPAIENGFYYDFARETPFTPEDLEAMEARMAEIVDRDLPIEREVWQRDEAVRFFREWGEEYKARLIEDLPADETITVYRQGEWLDLCRGPHLPSTGKLGKAFKLLRISGAYWRGDARNEMLQRVYGTAWPNRKALAAYLHMLEEAEKRDHRKLGRQMDLFHMQEESPGGVFWHPRGWQLVRTLTEYMRMRQDEAGYQEVNTPQLMDRSLWEASGHWDTFHENMFTSETEDGRMFAVKPMNCPGHVQIFKHGLRSYRELPLRVSEFGHVHRYEPSGALQGLMRVRAFCQDDAHIFCTPEQVMSESKQVCDLIRSIYADFGFTDIHVKFADRPEKRVGDDTIWDKSEAALQEACRAAGIDYELNPGEGAFYGPKLEFTLFDAIGRPWQCGTLQVDLNLPVRLGAEYVTESGDKATPVMLHRALFGSIERFIGILIENYAGNLPLWLSPQQVTVATITSDGDDYAAEVVAACRAAGLRADADLRNEKISYKVREHSAAKVPVIMAVGRREVEEHTVAIRRLGSKAQTVLPLDEAVASLADEVAQRVTSAPSAAKAA